MVKPMLAGTKTQTRRLASSPIAKAVPGQRLWVREGCTTDESVLEKVIAYEADENTQWPDSNVEFVRVRDALHMPRWASRLTLVVKSVRQELLQEISEADINAEGVSSRAEFAALWDGLYQSGSWDSNPLVAVIEFSAFKENIDRLTHLGFTGQLLQKASSP